MSHHVNQNSSKQCGGVATPLNKQRDSANVLSQAIFLRFFVATVIFTISCSLFFSQPISYQDLPGTEMNCFIGVVRNRSRYILHYSLQMAEAVKANECCWTQILVARLISQDK